MSLTDRTPQVEPPRWVERGDSARVLRLVPPGPPASERQFFIENLLVQIHFIIVMIRWTGLAPWEFEFPFSGSLTSTFLGAGSYAFSPVS